MNSGNEVTEKDGKFIPVVEWNAYVKNPEQVTLKYKWKAIRSKENIVYILSNSSPSITQQNWGQVGPPKSIGSGSNALRKATLEPKLAPKTMAEFRDDGYPNQLFKPIRNSLMQKEILPISWQFIPKRDEASTSNARSMGRILRRIDESHTVWWNILIFNLKLVGSKHKFHLLQSCGWVVAQAGRTIKK